MEINCSEVKKIKKHVGDLHFIYFSAVSIIMLLAPFTMMAQSKIEKKMESYGELITKRMDTSFINYQQQYWSLRALSTLKDHSFHLRNSNTRLNYTPNNRFGVGGGVAYFPLLIDIGFNLKGSNKDQTERFDIQADLILPATYLGLVLQNYEGFNVSGPDVGEQVFREDIHSSAVHFTYAHAFNSGQLSSGSIFSGTHKQRKSGGTFLLGGFTTYYQLKADSSLIPHEVKDNFFGLASLKGAQSFGAGVLGGYAHIFVLPCNLFLFANAMGGLGLIWKNIETIEEDRVASNPLLYRLNLQLSFGYKGPRFYVIMTSGTFLSFTPLVDTTWGALNVGNGKLVFGYKLRKRSRNR